ncbi:hypothetical protein GCM10027360_89060 [Amycolatopsis echigonensis]
MGTPEESPPGAHPARRIGRKRGPLAAAVESEKHRGPGNLAGCDNDTELAWKGASNSPCSAIPRSGAGLSGAHAGADLLYAAAEAASLVDRELQFNGVAPHLTSAAVCTPTSFVLCRTEAEGVSARQPADGIRVPFSPENRLARLR